MTAGCGKIVARLRAAMLTHSTSRTLLSKQAAVHLAQHQHQHLAITHMVMPAQQSLMMNAMELVTADGAGLLMTLLSGPPLMLTADARSDVLLP